MSDFIEAWGLGSDLNPDAWAAGTTIEDASTMVPTNTTGSIWGSVGDFITGIGETAQTFFGVAGDVRAAHDNYHNPAPLPGQYPAYNPQMMTYALIGAAALIVVLLIKD